MAERLYQQQNKQTNDNRIAVSQRKAGRVLADNRAVAQSNVQPQPKTTTVASMPMQLMAIDPKGQLLNAPVGPLVAAQQARLNGITSTPDVTVFTDQAGYHDYVLNDNKAAMKNLPGVDVVKYTAGLPVAIGKAENRQGLAPMKGRTQQHGTMVDNADFNKLTEHQVPILPKGQHIYKSQKHNTWKWRSETGANDPWKMAMYQSGANEPVAYNMMHNNELVNTLFQYGKKGHLGKRKMAGLEGSGKTPKWSDPNIARTGKKRKLNQETPNPTLVQGHGQDFEHSFPWVGDVSNSHNLPDKTKTPSANPIKTSDDHPFNFSPEHPTWGKNYRNLILGKGKKAAKKGAIKELTKYHQTQMNLTLPTGMSQVSFPAQKTLGLLDDTGKPIDAYVTPQTEDLGGGKFGLVDLAKIAETHSGKANKDLKMDDLAQATQQPTAVLDNPNLVKPGTHQGVNSQVAKPGDSAATKALLTSDKFMFLKSKDF